MNTNPFSTPPKGMHQQVQPRALFIQGVADDGLVKITADISDPVAHRQAQANLNRYASASIVSRHILGSLNHYEYVSVPGLVNENILLVGDDSQTLKFNIPQVIVNCIVDPDVSTRALKKEQELIERLKKLYNVDIPVINPPASISRTTRDQIYEQFKDLPGMHLPKAIRIAPESVADTVSQIKAAGITPPFLIRPTGTHGGKGMQRIESWDAPELLKLERYAYDGSFFYAIQWVDFKHRDKLYRKSRIAFIGGTPIPRHRIISDDWNIHSQSRKILMASRDDLRKEEEKFITSPFEQSVSKDAAASLRKVYETLGLDYFGVDCSVQEDGSLLIFEINAAFNTMEQGGLDTYPYLAQPVKRIIETFNDVVAHKATLARAA